MKIGDKFKYGRREYEGISTFVDDERELYVAKTDKGYPSYSIFCYYTIGEEKRLYQHT